MLIRVPERKNDKYRQGHTVSIVRSNKSTCPVSITEKLLRILPQSKNKNLTMVRRIIKSKSCERFHEELGVSYSTIKDEFKKFLGDFVDNIDKFDLHSLKSGAASNPGCRSLSGDLIDKHAGWRSSSSKNRYIKYNKNDLLIITESLGL